MRPGAAWCARRVPSPSGDGGLGRPATAFSSIGLPTRRDVTGFVPGLRPLAKPSAIPVAMAQVEPVDFATSRREGLADRAHPAGDRVAVAAMGRLRPWYTVSTGSMAPGCSGRRSRGSAAWDCNRLQGGASSGDHHATGSWDRGGVISLVRASDEHAHGPQACGPGSAEWPPRGTRCLFGTTCGEGSKAMPFASEGWGSGAKGRLSQATNRFRRGAQRWRTVC